MNLLFIYSRDIHVDDSGASRTIILRENYLAAKPNIKVYTSFHHLSPVDSRIEELSINELNPSNINSCIKKYNINILCVPEGKELASLSYEAVKGTNCKIVTELHNKPGFEFETLFCGIKSSLLYPVSLKRKFRAIIKLLLYPLMYSRLRLIAYIQNKKSYLFADKFVLLSDKFVDEFRSLYQVSKDKIVCIGNPLSFEDNILEDYTINKKNEILVVARLHEESKRISLIIKCWRLLEDDFPNWNLKIVGFGCDELMYKKMVCNYGLKHVFFEGWQSPERYYKEASIFLMTSKIEGWGMTILEAQQRGCVPIVMDTFSSLHEIINDGNNGFIVKDGDIESMANIIRILINNSAYRTEIALNALDSTERFSIDVIGSKWFNLYNSLL